MVHYILEDCCKMATNMVLVLEFIKMEKYTRDTTKMRKDMVRDYKYQPVLMLLFRECGVRVVSKALFLKH